MSIAKIESFFLEWVGHLTKDIVFGPKTDIMLPTDSTFIQEVTVPVPLRVYFSIPML